jgi:hypothetical protein
MKQVLLLSVAFTMGMNSLSFAGESSAKEDRVLQIATQTSQERADLRNDLALEIQGLLNTVTSLDQQIKTARAHKDLNLFLSGVGSLTAASGIILAILSARRMNIEKTTAGTFLDMGLVTASSAVVALGISVTDVTQAEFIKDGRKIDQLNKDIETVIDRLIALRDQINSLE